MKKIVFGLIMAKLVVLVLFWNFAFFDRAQPQPAAATPVPTVSPEASAGITGRQASEPYKGDLSIFEGEKRAENLQVERVMDILRITEGRSVADIGAGSGWFTVRAAQRAGKEGRIYAVEINEEAIKYIDDRSRKENLSNIQTVLGKPDDPLLPAGAVDAVLLLKTYHEIARPVEFLKNLRPALRPRALVGVIDRNGDGDSHGVNRETVVEEARRAGFSLAEEHDFVKGDGMDYFLVFQADNGKK